MADSVGLGTVAELVLSRFVGLTRFLVEDRAVSSLPVLQADCGVELVRIILPSPMLLAASFVNVGVVKFAKFGCAVLLENSSFPLSIILDIHQILPKSP